MFCNWDLLCRRTICPVGLSCSVMIAKWISVCFLKLLNAYLKPKINRLLYWIGKYIAMYPLVCAFHTVQRLYCPTTELLSNYCTVQRLYCPTTVLLSNYCTVQLLYCSPTTVSSLFFWHMVDAIDFDFLNYDFSIFFFASFLRSVERGSGAIDGFKSRERDFSEFVLCLPISSWSIFQSFFFVHSKNLGCYC